MQDDLSRSVLNLQSEKLELEKQVQWTNNFIGTLVFLLWSCGQQPPTQTFSGLPHASRYAMRAISLYSNILTTGSCNLLDLDVKTAITISIFTEVRQGRRTSPGRFTCTQNDTRIQSTAQFSLLLSPQKKTTNKIRRFFPGFSFPCEPYESFRYVILLDVSPSAHIMNLGCLCHYKISVNLL